LTETGVIYPTTESYAVAYSADGSFVAVRPQGGPLVVFPTGSTTPVNQFDSDQLCERNGAPDDLAFSADGSRLFVGGVVFQAISRPTAGMDPSAMTLAADPTPAPPGATVTISGTLAASGAPAAGKSIQLFESSPDGQSRRSLGSVATGLDGAFTKSVVLSAKGDYCFEARWSGDATHPGRARLVSVTIQSFPSALTLSASPGKIFPKDPVTLSGDLSFSGGGPVGGASVGIYRDGPSGPESLIHTSSVDADGHYSFVDHPTELGIYRYRARWAGNAAHDPAQGGYDYLTVRKQRTSLAVITSRSRITYGSPVRATAHLARHFSNDVVRIYGQVSGGSKTLLKRGRVDADGDISVRVRPGAKAWFWATWAGDRHFFPLTSAKEAVAVRSITRARLLGVDGRSGRYHLYRFTTRCSGPGHRDCPTVVGAVIPNHRGHRLLFDLEVLYRGTWQRVFTVGARIRSNGLAAEIFFYRNRRIIGVPTRVRARFPGDGDHIGSLSRWLYFKVVSALHGRSTPRHGRGGWGAIESFPVTRVDERGSRGPGGGS
jgi:hypothetical protein